MAMKDKTFGGYLPLELCVLKGHYHPSALRYLSARSALYHLLITLQPQRLWMPYLICQSVIDAVISAKIKIEWYFLDESFNPILPQELNPDDFLFFVDYLGQCSLQKKLLLQRVAKERIILDYSQAFFAPQLSVGATLYSPRKFFGVPDGGLLVSGLDIPKPKRKDCASLERIQHLIIQHEVGTREGYLQFMNAESTLANIDAVEMSNFTERMLCTIDYFHIKQRRESNYRLLHERLAKINRFNYVAENPDGPFCYPLYFPERRLHDALIQQGLFIPTYWKEVLERLSADSVEGRFVNCMLAIPCDQRYNLEDIDRICSIVLQVAAGNEIKVNK